MGYLEKIVDYHEKHISDYDNLYYNMEKEDMYFIPEDYSFFIKYDTSSIPYAELSNDELFDLLNIYKKRENTCEIKKIIEEIKTALIIKNIRLINWTIRHFYYDLEVELEDLQECGLEGLMYAIDGYCLDKNCLFTKYAIMCIFSSIKNKMKNLIGISYKDYNERKMVQHYRDEILKLSVDHHEATNTELTSFVDLVLADINKLDDIYEVEEYNDDITSYEEDDVNYEIILQLFKSRLPLIFTQLKNRQLAAILFEYGFLNKDVTRNQVGDYFHVSSETIRKDAIKALKQLREFYKSDEIEYIISSSYNDKDYIYINELYTKYNDYLIILGILKSENDNKILSHRDFERKIGRFRKLLSYVKNRNMTSKQIIDTFYEKFTEILSYSFVNEMISIYRVKKQKK